MHNISMLKHLLHVVPGRACRRSNANSRRKKKRAPSRGRDGRTNARGASQDYVRIEERIGVANNFFFCSSRGRKNKK